MKLYIIVICIYQSFKLLILYTFTGILYTNKKLEVTNWMMVFGEHLFELLNKFWTDVNKPFTKKFQRWNYIISRFPRGIVPVIPKLVCYWSYPSGVSTTMTNCRCLIPYQNQSTYWTRLKHNVKWGKLTLLKRQILQI